MNAALELQKAMRDALLAHVPLTALLGGRHIYDEPPRGEPPSYVVFEFIETRDWGVKDQMAHEHFVTIEIATNERGRSLAQSIAHEIELVLHDMPLPLLSNRLVNLRVVFWSIARAKSGKTFFGTMRFRATTEPL
jgi:Protein of unknown function (DUF3168)